jgi:hypothetical protein
MTISRPETALFGDFGVKLRSFLQIFGWERAKGAAW